MQNSRLHFIGTWRNRYRKRFPTLSTVFDNEISNINASSVSGNSVVIHVDMVGFTYMLEITNCCQLIFFVQCLSDFTFKNKCYVYVVVSCASPGLLFCLGGYQEPP